METSHFMLWLCQTFKPLQQQIYINKVIDKNDFLHLCTYVHKLYMKKNLSKIK